MATIITDLKENFRRGNIYIQLIYINAAVFIFTTLTEVMLQLFNRSMMGIFEWLELPASLSRFILQPWSLLTYMFMHGGFTHILFNMFTLWMFGGIVEQVWGPKKFLFYYIACGVGAGVIQMVAQLFDFYSLMNSAIAGFGVDQLLEAAHRFRYELNAWTTVALRRHLRPAAGLRHAVSGAAAVHLPSARANQGQSMVCIWIVVELLSALGTQGSQVAHFAHLGGMLFGYIMIRYWRNHPATAATELARTAVLRPHEGQLGAAHAQEGRPLGDQRHPTRV